MRSRAYVVLFLALGAGALHCASRPRTQHARAATTTAGPAQASPSSRDGREFRAVSIAAGRNHACARTADGKVFCWGANNSGQLGDGTRVSRTRPTAVAALEDADTVVAGDEHTCARSAGKQTLVCWGQNAHGELGDGTLDGRLAPTPVSDLHAVLSVSAGGHTTCARKTNRFVMCWGEVQDGAAVKAPTPVFGMTETEEVSVGALHACARLAVPGASDDPRAGGAPGASGAPGSGGAPGAGGERPIENVRCWGSNRLRQLGIPRAVDRGLPVAVPHLENVSQLALGHEHSCARTAQGATRCWGGGLRCVPGEWFEGKRVAVKPGAIPGMDDVTVVAAGGEQACAIRKDGSVVCAREKAATGDRSCISEPIAALSTVSALALGDAFGCALKTDGTIWCWGKNDAGQLGDGTTRSHSEPSLVTH